MPPCTATNHGESMEMGPSGISGSDLSKSGGLPVCPMLKRPALLRRLRAVQPTGLTFVRCWDMYGSMNDTVTG